MRKEDSKPKATCVRLLNSKCICLVKAREQSTCCVVVTNRCMVGSHLISELKLFGPKSLYIHVLGRRYNTKVRVKTLSCETSCSSVFMPLLLDPLPDLSLDTETTDEVLSSVLSRVVM
mmetsp:Transcript_27536/g.30660  ORF Transcript_27536/g.30660 Transcript_27536/m.30660 type:complete len:118 (+) Transcript_27536:88-441(+)